MCNAGIEVLDVYPLTASYPGGALDAVHYVDSVFASVEQLLEKTKAQSRTASNRKEEIKETPCLDINY